MSPSEHSAGAVVFRIEQGQVLYLLLHYEEGHWGSPKGHIEKQENIEETARREIREETGLSDIRFIPGFKGYNRYYYTSRGKKIFKTVVFLLAETRTAEIKLSREHIGYEWMPLANAKDRITFEDERKLLQKADRFIAEAGIV